MPDDAPRIPSVAAPALVFVLLAAVFAGAACAFSVKTLRARADHDAQLVDAARDLARRARERARQWTREREAELRARDADAQRRVETLAEDLRRRLAPPDEKNAASGEPKTSATSASASASAAPALRPPGLLEQFDRLHAARARPASDPALDGLRRRAETAMAAAAPELRLSVYEDGLRRVFESGPPAERAVTAARTISHFDGRRPRHWTLYASLPAPTEPRPFTADELARRLDEEFGLSRLPAPARTGQSPAAWRLALLDADERPAAAFPQTAFPERFETAPSASAPLAAGTGTWRVSRVDGEPAWAARTEHFPALPPCPWSFAMELAREQPTFVQGWTLALADDPAWAACLGLSALLAGAGALWTVSAARARGRNLARAAAREKERAVRQAALAVLAAHSPAASPQPSDARRAGQAAAADHNQKTAGNGNVATANENGNADGHVDPDAASDGGEDKRDPSDPAFEPEPGASVQRIQEQFREPGATPARPLDAATNPLLRALARRVRPRADAAKTTAAARPARAEPTHPAHPAAVSASAKKSGAEPVAALATVALSAASDASVDVAAAATTRPASGGAAITAMAGSRGGGAVVASSHRHAAAPASASKSAHPLSYPAVEAGGENDDGDAHGGDDKNAPAALSADASAAGLTDSEILANVAREMMVRRRRRPSGTASSGDDGPSGGGHGHV